VVDGDGAALLPGLHDHHCHVFAMAAALTSVGCGPPEVCTRAELRTALGRGAGDGWVRGVGYDESVAGPLDRHALDGMVSDRPVRVQHRGGSLWTVNSRGLEALGIAELTLPGVERDGAGIATGRLWRLDDWLRKRLGDTTTPDLSSVGRRLARYGVTGLTDATPGPDQALLDAAGALPQHLVTMGDAGAGPRKIVVSDHDLPGLDDLVRTIADAHAGGRPVAVHSVTRESLLLVLVAFGETGAIGGDRVEHAAVAPPEAVAELARLGITVVTQPSFVARRGADYLRRVEPADRGDLWRYRSLLEAGVAVGCSSDAPYGDADPWQTVRAARDRITLDGRVLGEAERVEAAIALTGFLSTPEAPGGPARRVRPGAAADLMLLDCALPQMLADPDRARVRVTVVAGRVVFDRSLADA
jgi:predicted amidohydrolase YtcJ